MTAADTRDWLTREEIDRAIDEMSASDLIEAIGDGNNQGTKMAGTAFDLSAARLGISNGTAASSHVRVKDFKYLTDRLAAAIDVEAPKA